MYVCRYTYIYISMTARTHSGREFSGVEEGVDVRESEDGGIILLTYKKLQKNTYGQKFVFLLFCGQNLVLKYTFVSSSRLEFFFLFFFVSQPSSVTRNIVPSHVCACACVRILNVNIYLSIYLLTSKLKILLEQIICKIQTNYRNHRKLQGKNNDQSTQKHNCLLGVMQLNYPSTRTTPLPQAPYLHWAVSKTRDGQECDVKQGRKERWSHQAEGFWKCEDVQRGLQPIDHRQATHTDQGTRVQFKQASGSSLLL